MAMMKQCGSTAGLGCFLMCLSANVAALATEMWPSANQLILIGDVITMDKANPVIRNGKVVVAGKKIQAVLKPDQVVPPGGSFTNIVETGGYICPGLIDAHNHVEYNMLPLWNVPRKFANRYEWAGTSQYKRDINLPKKLLTESKRLDMEAEVIKYGEVKALLGGVTSIQGSPQLAATAYMVRNIENRNFDRDRIYQHGLSIDDGRFKKDVPNGILKRMNGGLVDAFLIHLAEGTDTKSLREFDTLRSLGLVRGETVIIHGTALTSVEFSEMARTGMKLIWSPLSNLLLYGKTTDIVAARRAGVLVCLGADWSPSGCKSLLEELKIAHEYDKHFWSNSIPCQELVNMVTYYPSVALGLDDKIGRIKDGFHADITVFGKVDSDPYLSVVRSTERDVKLVVIDGIPYYGEKSVMDQLKPGDNETIEVFGSAMAIDVTDERIPGGNETLAHILRTLDQALLLDREFLSQHLDHGGPASEEYVDKTLSGEFKAMRAVTLDPLLPDDNFFAALRQSVNANLPFDIQTYWQTRATVSDSDKALLALANKPEATVEYLDKTVGISSLAARNIVAHRDGPDGRSGTPDDDQFDSVQELDSVPQVGPSTLSQLRNFAVSNGR